MGNEFKDELKVPKQKGKVIDFSERVAEESYKEFERKTLEIFSKSAEEIRFEQVAAAEARKEQRLLARKGSAHKAKNNIKLTARGKAMILAIIAAGTISIVTLKNIITKDTTTIGQLVENNADMKKTGLDEETIESLLYYADYFENTDAKTVSISELSEVSEDLKDLDLSVIKQKMAMSEGKGEDYYKVYVDFNETEGYVTSICKYKEQYEEGKEMQMVEEIYSSSRIASTKGNTLPSEIATIAEEWITIRDIGANVENRKISTQNAFKDLSHSFKKLDNFSTRELVRNEKGKLKMVSYEDYEQMVSEKGNDGQER